ncbi:MAG: NAD-dependent epimerase/dehydratase family protein [Anaerolineales bacterium]
MKTIIVGGTGFLGYHAGLEFLQRGHQVTALGLPPLPLDEGYLKKIDVVKLTFETATDAEILIAMGGQETLVFAAGADDRVTPKKPAYPFFHYHNVEVVERILHLAKKAGIKRAIVLGSYFVHFNRIWSERKLADYHPYIRSRVEQEQVCLNLSSETFQIMVLELPYIFGSMEGRVPLWKPLVNMARTGTAYFCSGGTNCVSVKSVAEAIVGAAEKGDGGKAYLIGDENLSWEQMFQGFGRGLRKKVKVITLPKFVLQVVMLGIALQRWIKGIEGGLDPIQYVDIQIENTFFDPTSSQLVLGYSRGDLEQAFKDTVNACS